MHSFDDLLDRSISFSLHNLDALEAKIIIELQTSGATYLVKNLQMITMQRVILAVGILSIFEAYLQDQLDCTNGFEEARKLLKSAKELALEARFDQFIAAVNVLKHGRGRSYKALQSQIDSLPFRLKTADEELFSEGDVSEISTLVEIDSDFVQNCAHLIRDVTNVVQKFQT
jgi:hypothetical protein